jgi:hypothetical protein
MNRRFYALIVGFTAFAALVGCNSTPSVPTPTPQLQQGMQNITKEQYDKLQKQDPIDRQTPTSGTVQTRNGGSCAFDTSYGNIGQIGVSAVGGPWFYWSAFMYQGSWSLSYQIRVNNRFYSSGYGSAGYFQAPHFARVDIDIQGFGSLGYTRGFLTCYVD